MSWNKWEYNNNFDVDNLIIRRRRKNKEGGIIQNIWVWSCAHEELKKQEQTDEDELKQVKKLTIQKESIKRDLS